MGRKEDNKERLNKLQKELSEGLSATALEESKIAAVETKAPISPPPESKDYDEILQSRLIDKRNKELQDIRAMELLSSKEGDTIKEAINLMLKDKVVAKESDFTRSGEKKSGISAGYIAKDGRDNQFMLKGFHKKAISSVKTLLQDPKYKKQFDNIDSSKDPEKAMNEFALECQKGIKQLNDNRRDGISELMGSAMYQKLLYDRTPKEALVETDAKDILYVRSKFFDKDSKAKQLSVFTGGTTGVALGRSTNKLKGLEGFEKVIAACNMLGEVDYHAGNLMVLENGKTLAKIDHGRSFNILNLAPTKELNFKYMFIVTNVLFDRIGYNALITNGTLKFNIKDYSKSLKQMVSQFDEDQVNAIVDQRIAELKKAGFDPKDIVLKGRTIQNFDELGNFYKGEMNQHLENMKEFSLQIETVARFSNVSPEFKEGKWLSEIAKSGCRDPIAFAKEKGYQIDGLDPDSWKEVGLAAAPVPEVSSKESKAIYVETKAPEVQEPFVRSNGLKKQSLGELQDELELCNFNIKDSPDYAVNYSLKAQTLLKLAETEPAKKDDHQKAALEAYYEAIKRDPENSKYRESKEELIRMNPRVLVPKELDILKGITNKLSEEANKLSEETAILLKSETRLTEEKKKDANGILEKAQTAFWASQEEIGKAQEFYYDALKLNKELINKPASEELERDIVSNRAEVFRLFAESKQCREAAIKLSTDSINLFKEAKEFIKAAAVAIEETKVVDPKTIEVPDSKNPDIGELFNKAEKLEARAADVEKAAKELKDLIEDEEEDLTPKQRKATDKEDQETELLRAQIKESYNNAKDSESKAPAGPALPTTPEAKESKAVEVESKASNESKRLDKLVEDALNEFRVEQGISDPAASGSLSITPKAKGVDSKDPPENVDFYSLPASKELDVFFREIDKLAPEKIARMVLATNNDSVLGAISDYSLRSRLKTEDHKFDKKLQDVDEYLEKRKAIPNTHITDGEKATFVKAINALKDVKLFELTEDGKKKLKHDKIDSSNKGEIDDIDKEIKSNGKTVKDLYKFDKDITVADLNNVNKNVLSRQDRGALPPERHAAKGILGRVKEIITDFVKKPTHGSNNLSFADRIKEEKKREAERNNEKGDGWSRK